MSDISSVKHWDKTEYIAAVGSVSFILKSHQGKFEENMLK